MSIRKPPSPPSGPSGISRPSPEVVHHEGTVQLGAEQRITSSVDEVGLRWMALQAAFVGLRGLSVEPSEALRDAVQYEAYLRDGAA